MKRVLKFIGITLILLLIAGVCYFANAFFGNPVSYFLANYAAKEHIKNNYEGTDYEIERVAYSFKTGDYYAYLSSPTNIDGDFTLTIDFTGKIEYDNYSLRVEGRANTEGRLLEEYRELVEEGLFAHLEYKRGYSQIMFSFDEGDEKHEDALHLNELELNKEYDIKALAEKQGHISISAEADEANTETLAEILLEVKRIADNNGIPFYTIQVSLFKEGEFSTDLVVRQFLYSDIYEDGLADRVEKEVEETRLYYEQKQQEKEEELNKIN